MLSLVDIRWRDVKATRVSQIIGAQVECSRSAYEHIAAQAEISYSQRKESTALKVTVKMTKHPKTPWPQIINVVPMAKITKPKKLQQSPEQEKINREVAKGKGKKEMEA